MMEISCIISAVDIVDKSIGHAGSTVAFYVFQFQAYSRIAKCFRFPCLSVSQDASPPTSSRPPTPTTPATFVGAGDPPQPSGAVLPPVPSPSGRSKLDCWRDGLE